MDGVSFEVGKGEVVGILGPNGAGKSTTIRILTGFLPATSGLARVAGHDVARESLAARRQLGYLPENVPLYPEMRVEEYLHFRARLKGVAGRDRKSRVDHVISRCWLVEMRRRLIGTLSKGYRQRVGIADALVANPPILILDEPTVGLDPNQVRQLRDLIRELGADHTVLLSTHILPEVEAVCGRVLVIHRGRLVFAETLANVAAKAARTARLRVEPADPAAPVADGLRALPEVAWVEPAPGAPGALVVRGHAGADLGPAVFRACAARGWVLRALAPEHDTLEDIFASVTIGDGVAPEPAPAPAPAPAAPGDGAAA